MGFASRAVTTLCVVLREIAQHFRQCFLLGACWIRNTHTAHPSAYPTIRRLIVNLRQLSGGAESVSFAISYHNSRQFLAKSACDSVTATYQAVKLVVSGEERLFGFRLHIQRITNGSLIPCYHHANHSLSGQHNECMFPAKYINLFFTF